MSPVSEGIRVLKELTEFVKEEGDTVITPYLENEVEEWNRRLEIIEKKASFYIKVIRYDTQELGKWV